MMNIQQKRDLLMSLPLMEQEQRWIMERLDTLSVKEQYQLSAAILRTGKLEELAGKTGWELETAILHMDPEVAVDAVWRITRSASPRGATRSWGASIYGTKAICRNAPCTMRTWRRWAAAMRTGTPACSLETAMWSTRNTPPHLVAPARDSSRRMTAGA